MQAPRAPDISVTAVRDSGLGLLKGLLTSPYQHHQLISACVRVTHSAVSDCLRPHGPQPARPLHPWDSPGKSTGVDCHARLRGSSLTQRSKLHLLLGKRILYQLSHQGSPILVHIYIYFSNAGSTYI